MIKIAVYSLLLVYKATCSWIKVLNCHGKLLPAQVANDIPQKRQKW